MKINNNYERIAFIIIALVLMYIFNDCTPKKKIDYKKNPHYPYIIEK
jgi:hypothetical protein